MCSVVAAATNELPNARLAKLKLFISNPPPVYHLVYETLFLIAPNSTNYGNRIYSARRTTNEIFQRNIQTFDDLTNFTFLEIFSASHGKDYYSYNPAFVGYSYGSSTNNQKVIGPAFANYVAETIILGVLRFGVRGLAATNSIEWDDELTFHTKTETGSDVKSTIVLERDGTPSGMVMTYTAPDSKMYPYLVKYTYTNSLDLPSIIEIRREGKLEYLWKILALSTEPSPQWDPMYSATNYLAFYPQRLVIYSNDTPYIVGTSTAISSNWIKIDSAKPLTFYDRLRMSAMQHKVPISGVVVGVLCLAILGFFFSRAKE